jgi:hypothetical protein
LDSADRSLAVSTAAAFEDGATDIGAGSSAARPRVSAVRDPHAGRTLGLQSIKAVRLQLYDLA